MSQSITEFLLARVSEDEAALAEATATGLYGGRPTFLDGLQGTCDDWGYHSFNVPPERFAAECAAKRAIVESARAYSPELEHGDNGEWAFDLVLEQMAAVYSDHRDYRSVWSA